MGGWPHGGSAVELTRHYLERIDRHAGLNAFLTVDERYSLAQAQEADRALAAGDGLHPLTGIPVALKDNIPTAGMRTTAGSRILEDWVPDAEPPVVERLRSYGAVVIGKTNLHEFAYGGTSENEHFGPVRNPWDPDRVAGGSSGGSAVAVAAGPHRGGRRDRCRRLGTHPPACQFNLSGGPAISVPCGLTPDGMRAGLQIASAPGRDELVLRLAAAYEHESGGASRLGTTSLP